MQDPAAAALQLEALRILCHQAELVKTGAPPAGPQTPPSSVGSLSNRLPFHVVMRTPSGSPAVASRRASSHLSSRHRIEEEALHGPSDCCGLCTQLYILAAQVSGESPSDDVSTYNAYNDRRLIRDV